MRGGDTREAVGQHHVRLGALGEKSSWPPGPALQAFTVGSEPPDSLAGRQQLVTCSVVGQPASLHDFSANRYVCYVLFEFA